MLFLLFLREFINMKIFKTTIEIRQKIEIEYLTSGKTIKEPYQYKIHVYRFLNFPILERIVDREKLPKIENIHWKSKFQEHLNFYA